MTEARVVVAEKHEIHLIQELDTAWHQLDSYCACGPDIYLVPTPAPGMWVRMEHLHYGPKEEFESEEAS